MHPILGQLTVGDTTITVHAYSTFLALAALAAVVLAVRGAGRLGVARRHAALGFALAVGAGLVGARLLDVALDWGAYAEDPARVVALSAQGFALYGGILAGFLTAIVLAHRWRVSGWALADACVPAVASGIVLARIGCFLNGCCAGDVTTLPWGVTFPYGSSAWGEQVLSGSAGLLGLAGHVEPVHPTQLYEAGAAIVLAALALTVGRRAVPTGTAATTFGAGFLAFRTANQLLRPESPGASLPEPVLVLGYGLVALVAVAALGWRLAAARSMGQPEGRQSASF